MDGVLHDAEDSEHQPHSELATTKKKSKARAASPRLYNRRASHLSQPRITDLIPKRPWAIALLVLAAGLLVGVINALHMVTRVAPPEIADKFALIGTGSLSSWCSSLVMMACCLASLQIYAIRQHRQDDYQGTYRVWLLFAGILLLASLHCIVDLGEVVTWLVSTSSLRTSNSMWFTGLALAALAGIFLRGLVEVRASRGTLSMVCVAWLIYVIALIIRLPQVQAKMMEYGLDKTEIVQGNTIWTAHLALFVALVIYSRYLFLTSNGLIALPVSKIKKKSAGRGGSSKAGSKKRTARVTRAKTSNERDQSTDEAADQDQTDSSRDAHEIAAAHQTSKTRGSSPSDTTRTAAANAGPLSSKMKPKEAPGVDSADEEEDRHENGSVRLSKAERRKLRKQQAAARRAA